MIKKLKIAVTGASGMLGSALLSFFSQRHQVFATSRSKGLTGANIHWDLFDLTDKPKLIQWLKQFRPDVVIHAAALINMDSCEKNYLAAYAVHVDVAITIIDTLAYWRGRCIYISSDAVFDGRKSDFYSETDEPNPLSVYGKTKRAGEMAVLARENGTVLRTNIFGWKRKESGPSFAEWVLSGLIEQKPLTMFTDVFFTPIYVGHVAKTISMMLVSEANIDGVFNLAGFTKLSKYEFALKTAQAFNVSAEHIIPVSIDAVGLLAPRPKNMALSNLKLIELLGEHLPSVEEGIAYFKLQQNYVY